MKHSFYDMCDYFEFLDDLRTSGKINMFGAAPHLAAVYGLDVSEARSVLRKWQDTFGNGALEDRVSEAKTSG